MSDDKPILLLGLGNDILCDDAVGLHIAREAQRRLSNHPRIDVKETTEMGLSLLDHIVGYHDLIIVDSIQTKKAAPGFIHEIDPSNLRVLPIKSPHFFGVGEILTLGRNLGMIVPRRVRIFAIEVSDPFTITEEMTPAIREAMPQALERIVAALEEFSATE